MEAIVDDSRILVRPFPSLTHLSTVGVALPFLNNFDLKTLKKAFSEIQHENAVTSNVGSQADPEMRAKKALLLIPPLLRKSVLEAVHGMDWEMEAWRSHHAILLKLMEGDSFQWKSDGTIDTMKIAHQLMIDQNINVKKRFNVACRYGLDGYVKSLWSQMNASDKKKCNKFPDNSLIRYWVRWLRKGSPVPWTRAAGECEDLLKPQIRIPFTRISDFFPSSRLVDRMLFLELCLPTDFLPCFYAMSRAEQEEVLRKRVFSVVILYAYWPLQSLFVETAEKLFRFMDADDFRMMLSRLWRMDFRGDFDYSELFRELWSKSPDSWKERARKDRDLKMAIPSWVDEENKKENSNDNNKSKKGKRKADSDTGRKRTRKNRKL